MSRQLLLRRRAIIAAAAGAAPPFAPSDIAGLTFWIDADQISGLVDGDAVTTWSDLSATGAHVTQGTAGNKPVYKTAIQNGLPVVRFTTDDYLATSTAAQFINSTSGQWTAFAVAKRTSDTGTQGILTGDNIGGSANRIAQFLRWNTTTPQAIAWNGPATDNGPTGSAGAFHIDEAHRTSTTLDRLVDGVSNGTTAASSPTTGSCGLGVGLATGQGGVQAFLTGDIAEIVLYNTALSSTDRTRVRDYLADKWGITI